jgi:hypothetical protein
MCCEIKIKLKNEDRKLEHKHLCYEPISFSREDATLQAFVKAAAEEFNCDRSDTDITIFAKMEWQ